MNTDVSGSKYSVYPEYKDSGVVWLGNVPKDWVVTRIGFLSHKTGSGKTPKGGSEIYSDHGVLFLRSQNVYNTGLLLKEDDVIYISEKIDEEMSGSRVLNGDILLNITGASIGRTCIVPDGFQPANVNQHVCIIRTQSSLRKYLALYLKSASTKAQIDAAQNGAAREGLNFEQLSNISVCLPDNEFERDKIANFLDHETAKIDTLIEKQQQLIALLKEKRQAVISHAVTRGLNPNAPMKNSGVEWLGDVPEHWNVAAIRRYLVEHRQGYYTTDAYVDDGTKLLRITDLRSLGEISINDCPNVPYSDTLKNYLLEEGDVVFARTGGAGSFGVIPSLKEEVAYASYLIRFRFLPKHFNTNYLRFMLVADSFQLAVKSNIHGGVTQNIHAEDIKDTFVASPPLEEQKEISLYLDKQSDKYAELINQADLAIQLMQERRTALISAAVTGKIDVRNWQAPEQSEKTPEAS